MTTFVQTRNTAAAPDNRATTTTMTLLRDTNPLESGPEMVGACPGEFEGPIIPSFGCDVAGAGDVMAGGGAASGDMSDVGLLDGVVPIGEEEAEVGDGAVAIVGDVEGTIGDGEAGIIGGGAEGDITGDGDVGIMGDGDIDTMGDGEVGIVGECGEYDIMGGIDIMGDGEVGINGECGEADIVGGIDIMGDGEAGVIGGMETGEDAGGKLTVTGGKAIVGGTEIEEDGDGVAAAIGEDDGDWAVDAAARASHAVSTSMARETAMDDG